MIVRGSLRPALAFVGAGGIVAWASCAVYGTSLLDPKDASAVDGTTPDGAFVCNHATYPSRPDGDEAGVDPGEIVFAIRRFDFQLDGGTTSQGFDLDDTCTCPGPPSCMAATGQPVSCDDDAGRDNAYAPLLRSFFSFAGASYNPTAFNTRTQAGEFALLARVRNYNGGRNDGAVELAFFLSAGTQSATDGGAPKVPTYDGSDVWTVDPRSLLGGIAPPYIPQPNSVDTAAYVRDGELVAAMSQVDIEFAAGGGSGSLRVNLTGGVVVGRLVQVGGVWQIQNGIVAGRWPARKALTTLQSIRVPSTKEYLCGDSGVYAAIKPLACKALDISSSPQADNTNAPCDSISMALGFEATQAILGPVKAGVGQTQPCGATWSDDCP